jgi:hypothetical protein
MARSADRRELVCLVCDSRNPEFLLESCLVWPEVVLSEAWNSPTSNCPIGKWDEHCTED